MNWLDVFEHASYHDDGPHKTVVHEDAQVKVMMICFKAGQRVESCIMQRDVIFFALSGSGYLRANGNTVALRPGVIVTVQRGVERSVEAAENLLLIGVQTG